MKLSILVETDILLALISPEDKHHNEAARLLERFLGDSILSPYSLIEFDLLLRSEEIVVKEVETFYAILSDLLKYRNVGLLSTKPVYHGEAYGLRQRHKNLTYFDSLHASVGIVEDLELVSYDKEYVRIKELKYTHPSKYV